MLKRMKSCSRSDYKSSIGGENTPIWKKKAELLEIGFEHVLFCLK